jgi:hypothetical protein
VDSASCMNGQTYKMQRTDTLFINERNRGEIGCHRTMATRVGGLISCQWLPNSNERLPEERRRCISAISVSERRSPNPPKTALQVVEIHSYHISGDSTKIFWQWMKKQYSYCGTKHEAQRARSSFAALATSFSLFDAEVPFFQVVRRGLAACFRVRRVG